jgi:hypothetical protein
LPPSTGTPRAYLSLYLHRIRRPLAIVLAFVFGVLTIWLFTAAVQDSTAPLSTAYWYNNDLNKFNILTENWNIVTKRTLDNLLQNKGALPYSSNTDLNTIEGNIRGLVEQDFSIELDLSRHPKFDANPFYDAPGVDRISKDMDKEQYRRLCDQYASTKYTFSQIKQAYESQISTQEDSIIKQVRRPSHCYYTKNGNFGCG